MAKQESTSGISMTVRATGNYCNTFDGCNIGVEEFHEIMEVNGGQLPVLKYMHAPLPFDAWGYAIIEPICWTIDHKQGSFIGNSEIAIFEKLGVNVSYI